MFGSSASVSSMVSSGAAFGLTGPYMLQLAQALANGCLQGLPSAAVVTVTASGAAGAGAATAVGVTGVVPQAMGSAIAAYGPAFGVAGTSFIQLANAIASGVCAGLSTMALVGVSPSVGSGAGVGKITYVDATVLSSSIIANFGLFGIAGTSAVGMANAIANGISSYLMASGIIPLVSIVGPAGPLPSAAVFPANLI